MSGPVHLRRGEALEVSRAIAERHGSPVCTATIVRVASGRVSRWSGEAELAREELIRRGRCPEGYLPDDRALRWGPP